MRRFLISVTAGLMVCGSAWPGAEALPDIGTPADATITQSDEYQIGLMVVKGLRDAGKILEDPETTEYIQSIGNRLASHAQDGKQRFTFFVVKDPSINAFAL